MRPAQKVKKHATMELWHPALSSTTWVPRALKLTPTLRVRDTATKTIATGAAAVTILVGPYGGTVVPSDYLSTSQIGRYAADAGVPGVSGETFITPRNAFSLPAGTQGRINRIGLTLTCSGSSTNNPTSFVYLGTLRNIVDSTDFATYAAVRDFVESRAEMHTRSGFSLMQRPAHLATHPLDWTSWGSLSPMITAGPTGTQLADDSMCTMAIVLSATPSGTDTYQLTVTSEWDVLVADDAAASNLLASAHVLHPVMSLEHLEEAAAALFSVSGAVGFLSKAQSAAYALPGLGARYLPRILPALEDIAPFALV